MAELRHKELTDGILGTFYDVCNCLGFGFSEKTLSICVISVLLFSNPPNISENLLLIHVIRILLLDPCQHPAVSPFSPPPS